MKTRINIIIISILLVSPVIASAQLGLSRQECARKLGIEISPTATSVGATNKFGGWGIKMQLKFVGDTCEYIHCARLPHSFLGKITVAPIMFPETIMTILDQNAIESASWTRLFELEYEKVPDGTIMAEIVFRSEKGNDYRTAYYQYAKRKEGINQLELMTKRYEQRIQPE